MWQRKTPEDKRCHRHILAPFRPTGKERYRNAADKGAIQVIAGHRGWKGADYFRHIDRLAVGDSVTLTNLWETLTYTVADIRIIQPHEVDKIKIQQGRDLLTLLTASATVNGKDAGMTDGNAIVPLTVVNNPGFDLPKTGGYGTWMFTIGGVALLGAAAFIVIRSRKHKNEQ